MFPKPTTAPKDPKKINMKRAKIRRQSKRMKLRRKEWVAIRDAVIERDGGICQVCGATRPYGVNVHHVIFRSQGGPDEPWNLAVVCSGPGLSGCHILRCHGVDAKAIRAKLQGHLAYFYPEAYESAGHNGLRLVRLARKDPLRP